MYEDLFWSLMPVQAVPEPASLWLVGAGLVGLLGYGWRQRLRQGLLGRPASESGTSCRVDGPRDGATVAGRSPPRMGSSSSAVRAARKRPMDASARTC